MYAIHSTVLGVQSFTVESVLFTSKLRCNESADLHGDLLSASAQDSMGLSVLQTYKNWLICSCPSCTPSLHKYRITPYYVCFCKHMHIKSAFCQLGTTGRSLQIRPIACWQADNHNFVDEKAPGKCGSRVCPVTNGV